jgi:hypothetical protein
VPGRRLKGRYAHGRQSLQGCGQSARSATSAARGDKRT